MAGVGFVFWCITILVEIAPLEVVVVSLVCGTTDVWVVGLELVLDRLVANANLV